MPTTDDAIISLPNQDKPPKNKKMLRFCKILGAALLIIFFIVGVYFISQRAPVTETNYSDVYRLVPEKVSKSAAVRISLPQGVDKEIAKKAVVFNPKIEGAWVKEKSIVHFGVEKALAATIGQKVNTNFIIFQPNKALDLDKHYSVTVDLGEGKILAGDFLSVEDPKVIAIFPRADSEAPEGSKITIVFNRPMVPVTTLEELEGQSIPVEISPETEGKFKWISTNSLQFVPQNALLRSSSHYTVKVKHGFVSMDGLKVSDFESKFQTRNLRYGLDGNYNAISNQIYDEPVRIYFNQPVDLVKTKAEISLFDAAANRQIPFIARYAEKTGEETQNNPQYKRGDSFIGWNVIKPIYANVSGFLFNKSAKDSGLDETIIEIYPAKDKFGRENFWDFNNHYTINIAKAYPTQGDIILDQARTIDVQTSGIVASWEAVSDRTNYDSLTLFDPQGYLQVSFYEAINLSKSDITADNLQKIEYGEKCRDEQSRNVSNCDKVEDRKKIKISFKNSAINPGDRLVIKLEKITNDTGLQINKEPILQELAVFAPLKVSLGKLAGNYQDTRYLRGFYLCSNNPLLIPEKADLKKAVQANLDYQINRFNPSYLINWSEDAPCPLNYFATWVSGGFMPDSGYQMNLDVFDVFSQNVKNVISFTTGSMDKEYVDIFALQQRYSLTSPDKTALTFGVLNINYVNVAICKTSAVAFQGLYDGNRFDASVCSEYKTETITLPEKYWINNYFSVNLADYFVDPVGNYIIALSHPLFRNYQGNAETLKSYITITNLAVAEKAIAPATEYLGSDEEMLTAEQIQSLKNLYWVTDIKSQNPVAGATIKFYNRNGSLLGTTVTDSDGLAFSAPAVGVNFIVASLGSDSTVIMRDNDKLFWASGAENFKRAYIYTDKPLYRPEQTVHTKGILRIGYDSNYQMFNSPTVRIKAYNSKGNAILDKDVAINDFGTFNLDFVLDKDSPLGAYRICLGDSYYNCASFEILEYVPAAFEVKAKSSKEEYISKESAEIEIDANYYFGAPLDNAQVDYTLSSQNYYFDKYIGDEWFSFGWWDDSYYDFSGYYYGDNFISRGAGATDAKGNFKFSQKLDLQEMLKNNPNQGSKIIVLDATVKNNLGQSISSQQSFIVHMGQYYIGVRTDPYFVGKNQDFNLKVKTVDTAGKNINVNNITADINKVEWISAKRQEVGGVFSYKWEKRTTLVKSISLDTNNSGDWSQKVKLGEEGEYEIAVSGEDRLGNLIKSKYNVYVYGTGQASFRPSNDTDLNIKASKTELKPGEEGELIIESPYPKSKALITIERGKIFDYQIVDFVGNIQGYKFIAKDDYAPNVFVSVLLHSPEPAVKFAMQEFTIDSDKAKINIDVKSDKKFYSPGDEVKLDIITSDAAGKALKTEASVAVVDLSVLALKGNEKKNPLVFFYNGFPLTVSTASNIKNGIVEIEPPDVNTKGGSGGGGESTDKVRGDFRETAFWQANVLTGDDGKAEVVFKLPDNLTTWQAEVLGVTKDTKLGVNYLDFMSKKELMIVPLKPRFIVPGDTFSIGAQVFNQSDNNQTFKVLFKSDTLEFIGNNPEKSVNVNKGESQTVFFQVKAPDKISQGKHTFTISADGAGFNDAVSQNVVIKPNLTYEVTATANYTQGDGAKEAIYLPANVYPAVGGLTVRSSATLAVFLSDALNYLIGYPYGCAEQIASRLKAIAVVKSGLKIPNLADKLRLDDVQYQNQTYTVDQLVDLGLAELYNNQNYDGGFNMWGSGSSDYYITLRVVDALSALKKANYAINDDSLNKGADYLYSYYNQKRSQMRDDDVISLAAVLLQTDRYRGNDNLRQAISALAGNSSLLMDQLSVKSLAQLGVLVNSGLFGAAIKSKINDVLDNRLNVDSRGAFLDIRKSNHYYDYFESTIGNTALYLESLAVGRRDTAITDKVIRWLLSSRDKDGAWGSTQNTLGVVEAFTDYLSWKKETEALYTLNTNLNGKTIDTFSFNASTILEQNKKTLALSDFKLNDYNFLELNKEGKGSLYYDMDLKYYLNGIVQPRDEGFSITRNFYALDDKAGATPLTEAKAGEIIREHLTIVAPVNRKYVQIEDYIPAGLEIVDLSLATENKTLRFAQSEIKAPEIYPDFKEIRDDRAYVYTEDLAAGVYEFDYYLRALVPGRYLQLPAVVSEMYLPENFGRTANSYFQVK